jgi:hypothetical protein
MYLDHGSLTQALKKKKKRVDEDNASLILFNIYIYIYMQVAIFVADIDKEYMLFINKITQEVFLKQ